MFKQTKFIKSIEIMETFRQGILSGKDFLCDVRVNEKGKLRRLFVETGCQAVSSIKDA
jgi:hypothetical protein